MLNTWHVFTRGSRQLHCVTSDIFLPCTLKHADSLHRSEETTYSIHVGTQPNIQPHATACCPLLTPRAKIFLDEILLSILFVVSTYLTNMFHSPYSMCPALQQSVIDCCFGLAAGRAHVLKKVDIALTTKGVVINFQKFMASLELSLAFQGRPSSKHMKGNEVW